MINLYIDFDGVLVDTINETYKMIGELGIDLKDTAKVFEFYKNLDWNKVLSNTKEINNAFKNIELLEASKIYKPYILTTVNSLQEMQAKVSYIRSKNKNISVICVPKGVEKSSVVNASNSILVDDFSGNLRSWSQNGGLGIKFTNEYSDSFITIKSLNELMSCSFIEKIIETLEETNKAFLSEKIYQPTLKKRGIVPNC